MKKQKYLILIMFLFFAATSGKAQTDVTVHYNDGSEQIFIVSDEGKLYFSETNLMIDKGDGVPSTIVFSEIKKLTVKEHLSAISENTEKENMTLYPNPTCDFIRVSNLNSESMNIKIFDITGKLLLQGDYSPNSPIDVSHLVSGFYLIKINDITLKFNKL